MNSKTLALVTAAAMAVGLLACQSGLADSRIRVYADTDRPVVVADRDATIVIKVGLGGLAEACKHRRTPLNVAVVLDKSGSMQAGSKMENAKRGAIEVVERLDDDDIMSLVVYDTRARVVFPAQRVRDKGLVIDVIREILAGGNTALYGGVRLAEDEVREHVSWEYENRIILLSDGLANVGPSATEDLAYLGRVLAEEGISVTTIGVGLDYNEDLMTALASESGGNAYFAASAHDLPRIFAEETGEAMTVAARNVRIRVDCADGVTPLGVMGREGEISGRSMSVTVGKVYGAREKYALFEVQVPAGRSGRSLEAAAVAVDYVDPDTNERIESSCPVGITYDSNEQVAAERRNKQIVKEAALTSNSDLKREAVRLADKGDHAAAASLIERAGIELEKAATACDKDEEMLREAEACGAAARDIVANEGMTKYQRKDVVNRIYTQTTQQTYVPQQDQKEDAR